MELKKNIETTRYLTFKLQDVVHVLYSENEEERETRDYVLLSEKLYQVTFNLEFPILLFVQSTEMSELMCEFVEKEIIKLE